MSDLPRIALDLDGVVMDWDSSARKLLRERWGYCLHVSQNWNMIEAAVSKKHWQWLWTGGITAGLFKDIELFPNAWKGLGELAKVAEIVVVTSRPHAARIDTLYNIAQLHVPIGEVHILGSHHNKAEVRDDFELAVDDKMSHITNYLNTPSHTLRRENIFLWKQPHNALDEAECVVTRTDSWELVCEAAKRLRA